MWRPSSCFRWRYSLRVFFVALTLGTILLGTWVRQSYVERQARDRVSELEGVAYYGSELNSRAAMLRGRPFNRFRVPGIGARPPKTWLPDWLPRLLGEHHFERIVRVELRDARLTGSDLSQLAMLWSLRELDLSDSSITDVDVKYLMKLRRLKCLRLFGTEVGNECLGTLRNLPDLVHPDLGDTNVTDQGLRHLAAMPELRELSIWGTKAGDAGLRHLMSLNSLEVLDVRETAITDDGLSQFSSILPQCKVLAD